MLAAGPNNSTATPVLLLVFLMGSVIYLVGYRRAVMHRANTDYKRTKAILPQMRKAYWLSLWAAVKVGFWVALGFVLLVAWAYREARSR